MQRCKASMSNPAEELDIHDAGTDCKRPHFALEFVDQKHAWSRHLNVDAALEYRNAHTGLSQLVLFCERLFLNAKAVLALGKCTGSAEIDEPLI